MDSVPARLKNNETFILIISGMFQWCFSFFLHKKVQHCKSHGVLNKSADLECSGCISVGSCRSAAAENTLAFPRMRSIWFRECGQDLWTMCKGVMYNSNTHEQARVEAAKARTWPEAAS